MPVYATFFLFIVLASVGLPLLNGFVGEFLVLSGAFQAKAIYGILAATGVIWSAGYLLWMYQRVFYGKVTHASQRTLPDLNAARTNRAVGPCCHGALVMGVAPLLWLSAIDPAVQSCTRVRLRKWPAGWWDAVNPRQIRHSSGRRLHPHSAGNCSVHLRHDHHGA